MEPITPSAKKLALSRIKNGDSLVDISKDMDIHMVILREWEEALGDDVYEARALDLVVTEKALAMVNNPDPNVDKEQLRMALAASSLKVNLLMDKNMMDRESLIDLNMCADIIVKLSKTLTDQNGTTIINQAPTNDSLSLFKSSARTE